ncbi:iron chelate uptake ABC transporter family permease subunit [Flaviflagellibacter deserti]|uniref:Iron chelate uptake ABC transporter family permease subunit n=1 Tax=Flaviflagellibacter deserti TaxID=2267266 RepID=A0ABV9Z022_9HYPH
MAKRASIVLIGLCALVLGSGVAFMTLGLRGNLAFVLELRGIRLCALIVVGVAIGVSTVLFQTVTRNRILTPSIMGLDALFVLGQTTLVFVLGGLGFSSLDPRLTFAGEIGLLMVLALALFLPMLRAQMDMGMLLLVGVVLGVLFRSLTSLIARLIDPNDFAVAQQASFASFNDLEPNLLALSAVLTMLGAIVAWRMRHELDVISLGADAAIGLGIAWRSAVTGILILVAALVAVSTALVGPVAFLGLIAVALGERMIDTRRHGVLLPTVALVAVAILVCGQILFQHMLGSASALGVVVEFVGGIVFLALLLAGVRR